MLLGKSGVARQSLENRAIFPRYILVVFVKYALQKRCKLIGEMTFALATDMWMRIEQDLKPGSARLHGTADEKNVFRPQSGDGRMKALVVEHVALSAKFGVVPSQVRARVDRLAKSELARSVASPAAQCELEAIDLAIAPEALRECIDIQRRVAAAAPTARPLHVALVTLEFTQRGHSDGPIASAHARPFFGSATNHDNLRTPTGPSPEGR